MQVHEWLQYQMTGTQTCMVQCTLRRAESYSSGPFGVLTADLFVPTVMEYMSVRVCGVVGWWMLL